MNKATAQSIQPLSMAFFNPDADHTHFLAKHLPVLSHHCRLDNKLGEMNTQRAYYLYKRCIQCDGYDDTEMLQDEMRASGRIGDWYWKRCLREHECMLSFSLPHSLLSIRCVCFSARTPNATVCVGSLTK